MPSALASSKGTAKLIVVGADREKKNRFLSALRESDRKV
jgi:hypothetical protein